jgi:hypothetical protein
MERGLWCGMVRKGIVFDHGNTRWGYEKTFCVLSAGLCVGGGKIRYD